MKKRVEHLCLLYSFFVLFLLIGSVTSSLVYYALALGTGAWLLLNGKCAGTLPGALSLRHSLRFALPLIAPVVTSVVAVSALTALLLSRLGLSSPPLKILPFGQMLLFYVLLPVATEEFFFRFLPLVWLGESSPAFAAGFSAVMFGLIHCDLFQIPYAAFAGFLFICADLAVGNILPSVLFHTVNNLLSVLLAVGQAGGISPWYFFGGLALLCVVSLPFILMQKNKNVFRHILIRPVLHLPPEDKTVLPILPAVLAVAMAVSRLFFR